MGMQAAQQDIEELVALAKEGNSLGAHAEAQRLQSEFNDIRCALSWGNVKKLEFTSKSWHKLRANRVFGSLLCAILVTDFLEPPDSRQLTGVLAGRRAFVKTHGGELVQ